MQSFAKLSASSLVLIALSVCLQSLCVHAPMLFGQGSGPDIDPAKVDGNWWAVNGTPVLLGGAEVVNGVLTYVWINATRYTATSDLINDHVRTSAAKNIPHLHHESELDADERAMANLWFDYLFGAKDTPAKTERLSDAKVKTNCHTYAFSTLGTGTYNYWINDDGQGAYIDVPNAECKAVLKTAAAAGDLLMYLQQYHTTVVDDVDAYSKTRKLRWKGGYSGVYRRNNTNGSFDTPKYLADVPKQSGVAFSPETWKWDPTAMGKESQLWGGEQKAAESGKWILRKK